MPGEVGRVPRQLRWCGMALIAGGVLMVVATLLTPVMRRPRRLKSPATVENIGGWAGQPPTRRMRSSRRGSA
jgi:hypothetical protein